MTQLRQSFPNNLIEGIQQCSNLTQLASTQAIQAVQAAQSAAQSAANAIQACAQATQWVTSQSTQIAQQFVAYPVSTFTGVSSQFVPTTGYTVNQQLPLS